MSQIEKKSYSREFKLEAVKRLEAGESSTALAEELSVKRTKLYPWRDIVRRDGERAFPGRGGRRSKSELLAREHGAEGATQDRREGWSARSANVSWTWIFFKQEPATRETDGHRGWGYPVVRL